MLLQIYGLSVVVATKWKTLSGKIKNTIPHVLVVVVAVDVVVAMDETMIWEITKNWILHAVVTVVVAKDKKHDTK